MKSKKMLGVFLLVFVAISLQSQQTEKPVRQVNVKPDSTAEKPKQTQPKEAEKIDSAEILKKKIAEDIEARDASSERIIKKVESIAPKLNHAMYKLIVNTPSKVVKPDIAVAPINTKELPVNVSDPKIDTAESPKARKSFFRFKRNRE